jgi:2-polyprenyl-6-methoxyphenol hydroxylase-like FAD-dependent oxidoreductase
MIHWGYEIIQTLVPPSLWAQIHTVYCNPNASTDVTEGITFYNGHSGELLFRSPDGVIKRLLRHKLRKLLTTGIDIKWNKGVKTVSADEGGKGATVVFEDGGEEGFDVVIGADGPRSKVREILLGEEKAKCVQSEFVCGYTSTVLGKERAELALKAHSAWTMAYSEMGVCALGGKPPSFLTLCSSWTTELTNDILVDDAKDPDDVSTWTFNITRIWRGTSPKIEGDDAVKIIKENTLPFCEPFHSAAEALENGSSAFVRSLTYWRPVEWPNHGGRITLAGDSAHAMLPCKSAFCPLYLLCVQKVLFWVWSLLRD